MSFSRYFPSFFKPSEHVESPNLENQIINVTQTHSPLPKCSFIDGIETENLGPKTGRKHGDDFCTCANCSNLPVFTECGVCLETLQGKKIKSCTECANLVCDSCSYRMSICAVCRTAKPRERNRAMERLLGRLQLPCTNARHGCEVLLLGDKRLFHEKICNFAVVQCPVSLDCAWKGPTVSLQSHFISGHGLLVSNSSSISLMIDQFQHKAKSSVGKMYMGCFNCFDQLFFFKIILHKKKLKVYFCRIGYICKPTLYDAQQIFTISLAIAREQRSVMFNQYDFEDTNSRRMKMVKIPCSHFFKTFRSKVVNRVQINMCIEKDYRKSIKLKS